MKKMYLQKIIALGLGVLLIGGINAQSTDKYRIWAKDANVLHDYYHWGTGIGVVENGSSNFSIPAQFLESVTSGVNNAFNNCFLKFENVDFGTLTDSLTFVRNVPRGATVEFWIDREETIRYDDFFREGSHSDQSAPGDVIELSKGKFLGGYQHWYHYSFNMRWEKIKIAINPTGGKHDLYILFRTGGKSGPRQYLGGLYYMDLHRTLADEVTSLTTSESSIQLPIGKHILQYSYEPSTASTENLVWTVENESETGILTVDNGTVIAMKPGTATVKCTSSRTTGDVSLTYDITVVGTSALTNLRIEAEDANTIYNTYKSNAGGSQSFEIAEFQPKGVGNDGNSGLVFAWNTNFAVYENVDFGSYTDSITFYHADIRGAAVEFWLDRQIIDERHPARVTDPANDYNNVSGKELAGGVFLGRYDFLHDENFRGNDKWEEFKLSIAPASGVHDLYVVFLRGGRESNTGSYTDANTIYNKTVGHYDWFELKRKIANIYQIIPSETNVTMSVGEEKEITLTIVPQIVANSDVTWSVIEGSDYVSVDGNGKITANAVGSAKVRATANADNNVYAEIDVNVDTSTGVSDTEIKMLYSNPVTNILALRSNATIENIIIANISGRVVYQQNKLNNAEINLDCSTWSSGLYFVQIETAEGRKTLKITKQ